MDLPSCLARSARTALSGRQDSPSASIRISPPAHMRWRHRSSTPTRDPAMAMPRLSSSMCMTQPKRPSPVPRQPQHHNPDLAPLPAPRAPCCRHQPRRPASCSHLPIIWRYSRSDHDSAEGIDAARSDTDHGAGAYTGANLGRLNTGRPNTGSAHAKTRTDHNRDIRIINAVCAVRRTGCGKLPSRTDATAAPSSERRTRNPR